MVRKNDENLDLLRRTRIAWAGRAQLYVSLHENSIADSGNPSVEGGYSIHYWTPESLPFAEAVHEAYQSGIPFKDGGVVCNNLAVCRMTQMPSILTESAFIIVPEQEEMLLDSSFRDKIAATIAQGIQQFLKRNLP
jgi:N-acetylmuramoyl-L-alanine amidase